MQRQVHLLRLLFRTRISGTGICGLAWCVFLAAAFLPSRVLSWRKNNRKTKVAVKAHRSIPLFFAWFSAKGDSFCFFFIDESSSISRERFNNILANE